MGCVNNLQSLMKSCRDVSNNDIYDEICQKAAEMVSPEEICMPRIIKHQTMNSNLQAESPMNYYLLNLCYPFLDSVILQLDQQFSGHAEAVMRLGLPTMKVSIKDIDYRYHLFCNLQASII